VGDALAAVLAQGGELCPLYRTEVQRLHRSVRFAGATIEIAHDVGALIAGDRRQALDEVEFELKSGPPEALPALAQRWVTRFGLWWDVRPKAEQGVRLALGQDQVPAARSKPSTLTDDASPAQAWSLALQAALTHALPNAAEIAAGRGGPDHLHQLRVALRRLRVALRLFAPWSADAEAALALEQAWRLPFGVLGAARDADVIAQSLRPQLAQAGAPNFAWPQLAAGLAPGDCVRGVVFNTLLLRTLAMSLQPPALQAPANLEAAAAEVLRPAWRRVRRDGHDFLQASADARHRTRKRLKRFRYALDFLRPIYPRKDTQRLLAAVEDALVALGDLNDLEVAHEACRGQVERDPAAWFAVGWLAAQREPAIALAAARLLALDDAPRVWRGD
jgi:inorganic triphosphatase YgiF